MLFPPTTIFLQTKETFFRERPRFCTRSNYIIKNRTQSAADKSISWKRCYARARAYRLLGTKIMIPDDETKWLMTLHSRGALDGGFGSSFDGGRETLSRLPLYLLELVARDKAAYLAIFLPRPAALAAVSGQTTRGQRQIPAAECQSSSIRPQTSHPREPPGSRRAVRLSLSPIASDVHVCVPSSDCPRGPFLGMVLASGGYTTYTWL